MNATEQRFAALAVAQQLRMDQAQVKRRVHDDGGRELVAELLRDPDDVVGSMRLGVLLRAMHRFGRVRCDRLLREAEMHRGRLDRRVRELTEGERERLARTVTG